MVPGARYAGGAPCPDFVLFGEPEAVREGMERLAGAGADRVLAITTFGGLPRADATSSLGRLARCLRP